MPQDDLERRIGAHTFARILGAWRPPEGRALASALTDQIRLLVLDGRLPLGTRVPAERELAGALEVSRTTVAAAYESLRENGFLHSRRGSGSWTRLPDAQAGDRSPPLGAFTPIHDDTVHDLAFAALPAPLDAVRAAAAAAVGDLDAHLSSHGYDVTGLPVLRAAIARRYAQRGLPTTPDQILVTSGAQNAIALVLNALVTPGDRVLVEHPTYPNALDAIRVRGGRPVPVPFTADGWDLDQVTAGVRDAAPRLAYLIPDFQNPTGHLMPPEDREALVALARRTGTTLVIDETLSELPLSVPQPAPFATYGGAAESSLVITVGSASKIFWGGLRVGWIRGPAATIRRLASVRPAIDLGGAVLDHLLAARLIDDIAAVADARRTELLAARDHLRGRLAELFPTWTSTRPGGGLSLWLDLGAPVSSRLTSAARRHGVLLAAGPRFGIDGAFERNLRLPFTLRRDHMDTALDDLAQAWYGLDGTVVTGDHDPIAVA
ncbi:MAG: hypothetical protein ABS81_31400 [Pseudonocardia sp. SCN 72-86]|nr:MAG: hypothetical protein ABS81_31400 [Pseudonocardia sp. SCN 72-86]